MADKQTGVSDAAIKPKMKEEVTKSIKPSSRSLFETIESSTELTNMCWASRIHISRWLLHVDRCTKVAMQKCIFDIKLSKFPAFNNCNCEDNSDAGSLDDRLKSLRKIHSIDLIKAFCH